MSVVAGRKGNMKQPPGDGKRRNTGRRKDNAGGYMVANREQGKQQDWPTCGVQSTPSHTSIMLARHTIKCAHLPTRKSSGCIWVCTASSSMGMVISTVGRGVVPFRPE